MVIVKNVGYLVEDHAFLTSSDCKGYNENKSQKKGTTSQISSSCVHTAENGPCEAIERDTSCQCEVTQASVTQVNARPSITITGTAKRRGSLFLGRTVVQMKSLSSSDAKIRVL